MPIVLVLAALTLAGVAFGLQAKEARIAQQVEVANDRGAQDARHAEEVAGARLLDQGNDRKTRAFAEAKAERLRQELEEIRNERREVERTHRRPTAELRIDSRGEYARKTRSYVVANLINDTRKSVDLEIRTCNGSWRRPTQLQPRGGRTFYLPCGDLHFRLNGGSSVRLRSIKVTGRPSRSEKDTAPENFVSQLTSCRRW